MKYLIHCDGIAEPNPGHGAWAFIVFDGTGQEVASKSGYIGSNVTNNVAEYRAVIEALVWCHELDEDECLIQTDSQLVVNQLNGSWQVKSDNLRSWYDNAKDLLEPHVRIEWVKGSDNKADELTRQEYMKATNLYPHPREKGQYKVKFTPARDMPKVEQLTDCPF